MALVADESEYVTVINRWGCGQQRYPIPPRS